LNNLATEGKPSKVGCTLVVVLRKNMTVAVHCKKVLGYKQIPLEAAAKIVVWN
jgi:hypothetical protein